MAQLPPTVKQGSKGEAVKGLQNALSARSSQDPGPIDGIFGPATENAVKEFQRGSGLADDGIAGPRTWEALYVYLVQRGDTLSEIAEQQLGDANRWGDIHELNKVLVSDPDEISPGQVLALPVYAH
jgi:peptidoglycan hydrolase-like protein with peptidoglycan-binding domain